MLILGAMMPRWLTHITIAVIASLGSSTSRADLIVDSWLLGTGVSDSNSPGNPSESDATDIVQNPFNETLMAELNGSSSTAVHDFSWTADTGSFDIDVTHFLMELDGDTSTSGRITVHPAVDSIIAFDAFFDYAWPSAAIGGSSLTFSVFDNNTQEGVLSASDLGGNVGLGLPFGTLEVTASALLQAGGEYEIVYTAGIRHFDPTPPGTHGDGTGNIHFTITPVPEPATASLLIAGLLLSRRRPRSRRPRSR